MPRPLKPKAHKPKAGCLQKSSAFVQLHSAEIIQYAPGSIADVACGYGRHALAFSKAGYSVYCLDKNKEALSLIQGLPAERGQLLPLEIDLASGEWPFKIQELGGIINVHYFQAELIAKFVDALMPGGYLLIETIEDRGGNYLELPRQGFVLEHIKDKFDVLVYLENPVKVKDSSAVTLKVFARKIKTNITHLQ